MSLQFKTIKKPFAAKQWLLDGWQMFKKKPLTWVILLFIFNIIMVIGSSHIISRYIAALLLPVLMGGIYLAAHKSAQGDVVSIESLFSMFKQPKKLKQLLIMGGIGAIVVFLSGIFGILLTLPWSFALLFGVPLVVIKDEGALPALQNSLVASVYNLLPIIVFYLFTVVLMLVAAIPFGLGLFVLIPILFGASYSAFKAVFLSYEQVNSETNDKSHIEAVSLMAEENKRENKGTQEPNLGEKLATNMRSYMLGTTDVNGETDLPKGFEINYFDKYMHIIRHWHGFGTFSLILGTLVFNGVWIANDFWSVLMSDRELLLRLFSLTFIVIGAVLPYFVIASWLNKTNIYVSKEAIEIKHEPIPWLGNKRIETKNIKQLFVREKGGNSQSMTSTSNKPPRYSVVAITYDEQPFNLIKGLPRSNQAFFIEQKIEKYLGIQDEANPAEYGYGFLKKEE